MSYYDILLKYKGLDLEKTFSEITPQEIERAITSEHPGAAELLALLSPPAENSSNLWRKKHMP